ncbi:unnamed protein product [Ixodes hexagonus]
MGSRGGPLPPLLPPPLPLSAATRAALGVPVSSADNPFFRDALSSFAAAAAASLPLRGMHQHPLFSAFADSALGGGAHGHGAGGPGHCGQDSLLGPSHHPRFPLPPMYFPPHLSAQFASSHAAFSFKGLHPLCACCVTKPHAASPSHPSPATAAPPAAASESQHVAGLSQLGASSGGGDGRAIASPAAMSSATSRSSPNGSDDVTTTSSVTELRRKAREHSQAVMLQSAAILKPSSAASDNT